MLRPYEEFLATLTEDVICEIANTANKQMQIARETTENKQNLIGNQIALCSLSFSQEILKRYHEWLSEQI